MREDLVKSAVSFLSSEKVKTADKEKKVQFLKQKGLNEEEINEAFNRVESTATESSANVTMIEILCVDTTLTLCRSVRIALT